MHDAILVGINTIILDDPRLRSIHVPPSEGTCPVTDEILASSAGTAR